MSKIRLSNDVGIYGLVDADLLWTNNSVSSNFASQTINVNYSEYKYLFVLWIILLGGTRINTQIISLSEPSYKNANMFNIGGRFGYRNLAINANKTSLTFEDTNYFETYGGNASVRADMCIPYRIYGIK